MYGEIHTFLNNSTTHFVVSNYVSAVFIYALYQVAHLVALASIIYQIIMVYFVCVLFDSHKASVQQLIKRNCLSTQSLDQSRMAFNSLRDLVGKLGSVVGLLGRTDGIWGSSCLYDVVQCYIGAEGRHFHQYRLHGFCFNLCVFYFRFMHCTCACLPFWGIMLNNKVIL